ncbi:MAG: hypothetical protein M1827_006747 [Pycnora praestabilis]|nr:MAG: hypothetical protein M1827_006747 [Pycnora praestabilis]
MSMDVDVDTDWALTLSSNHPSGQTLPSIREIMPLQFFRSAPQSLNEVPEGYPQQLSTEPTGPSNYSTPASISTSPVHRKRSLTPQLHSSDPYRFGSRPGLQMPLPELPSLVRGSSGISPLSEAYDRRESVASTSSYESHTSTSRESPHVSTLQGLRSPPRSSPYELETYELRSLPSLTGRGQEVRQLPIERPAMYDPRHQAICSYPPTREEYELPSTGYRMAAGTSQVDYSSQRHASYGGQTQRSIEQPTYLAGTSSNLNFEVNGDYNEHRSKRRRGNLPKPVTDFLRSWFRAHLSHPYPSEEEKQYLMSRTHLSISQISNWFINARRRQLPELHKSARAEADIRELQGSTERRIQREISAEERRFQRTEG